MHTDTQYLRRLSMDASLPALMRDTLRDAANEIDRLREFTEAWRTAPTVEVKAAGTDMEGNCRVFALSTPEELSKGPSLLFKRARIVLEPNE